MDFGGFDDDFFEDSSKKKENKEIDDWKPHQAEPGVLSFIQFHLKLIT